MSISRPAQSTPAQSATQPPGSSHIDRVLVALAAALVVAATCSTPALAAGTPATGTTADQLITAQGSGIPTSFGDYVSVPASGGGLDEPLRFYVEVPPGTACLHVGIFDADVGTSENSNDAAGERDRGRAGFDTSAEYRLSDPSGASVTADQLFVTGDDTGPAGGDDRWLTLYAGDESETYLDQFGSASYGNDDGTGTWAGNWIEFGDNGSPTTGNVLITGGELSVRAATRGATREADLSGGCGAILTLDVDDAGDLEGNDCADVSVSDDGGSSWTILEEFCNDIPATSLVFDISEFVSDETQIRLRAVSNLGGGGEAFVFDDVQIELLGGTPEPGHWQLEVDMTDAVTSGDDINAFGIRAHDGDPSSSGTELAVYAESFYELGINDNNSSRSYDLHPYITNGCVGDVDNFDWDANNGGGSPPNPAPFGSWDVTSRSGAFTADESGSMSNDDDWTNATFTGWTTDDDATDYGIWNLDVSIATYTTSGNYGVFYLGSDVSSDPPPTAQPEPDTFRIYLPADDGSAPAKPYLGQVLTYVSGANPPSVGNTSRFRVSLQIVNPTDLDITFDSSTAGSDLITATIPGGDVAFVAGSISASQGAATHSSGQILWAPGTVTAGSTEVLFYSLDVTPSGAGRLPVTGTPSSNGTVATFVDETCTGASPTCSGARLDRATLSLGPLCELAVDTSEPTAVLLSRFEASPSESGGVAVRWTTEAQAGTVHFDLYRAEKGGRVELVREKPLPALLDAVAGADYAFFDEAADPQRTEYFLVETSSNGRTVVHGPSAWVEQPQPEPASRELTGLESSGAYEMRAKPLSPTKIRRVSTSGRRFGAAGQRVGDHGLRGLRLAVADTGLYRVTAEELAAASGLPVWSVRRLIRSNRLELTDVTDGDAPVLLWASDRGRAVDFVGHAPGDPVFESERIYRLQTGRRNDLLRTIDGTRGLGGRTQGVSIATQRFEEDVLAGTLLPLDPRSDIWFWAPVSAGAPFRTTFELGQPAADAALAGELTVRLQGLTAEPGRAEIAVDGVVVGTVTVRAAASKEASFALDPSQIGPGSHELTARLVSGAALLVDSFEVAYPRPHRVPGGILALAPGALADLSPVEVTGLPSTPQVFTWTDPGTPFEVRAETSAGPDGSSVRFLPVRGLGGGYLVAAASRQVGRIETDLASDLRDRNRFVDYLVLAPAAWSGAAQALADRRASQGLLTEVVPIEEVFDELSGGVRDPAAVGRLLDLASSTWRRAPRFVLILGAGTWDYRDVLGLGAGQVPPPLHVDAEEGSLFAADAAPEGMIVGRLPARSEDDVWSYLRKLDDFETRRGRRKPTVALLADDDDAAGDFVAASAQVAQVLPPGLDIEELFLGALPPASVEGRLRALYAQGLDVVHYAGHGGVANLAVEQILTAASVPGWPEAASAPVFVGATCHVNNFAIPGFESLGESMVLHEGSGASALWLPVTTSRHRDAETLDRYVARELFAGGEVRQSLGDALLRAYQRFLQSGGDPLVVQRYQLLGDPALLLPPARPDAGNGGPTGE